MINRTRLTNVGNDTRPLFQHGTLSTVDGAIALRYATYIDIAAELRRRAECHDGEVELTINDSIAEALRAYNPRLADRLRGIAERLEVEE